MDCRDSGKQTAAELPSHFGSNEVLVILWPEMDGCKGPGKRTG